MAEEGEPKSNATKPPEGIHDKNEARVVSIAPDVCMTPVGNTMGAIPYNIYDLHGHDQNYTPTVRYRGFAAMVLRSRTTHVHGDEAGTGGGVISVTHGGICEPIGHEPTVRCEGSPAIRDGDLCWMNNRNTIGKCVLVKNTDVNQIPRPEAKPQIKDESKGGRKTPQQELNDRVDKRAEEMQSLERQAGADPSRSDGLYQQHQKLEAQNDIDRFSNTHGYLDGDGIVKPLNPAEFLNDYSPGLGDAVRDDPQAMARTLQGLNQPAMLYAQNKMFDG